MKARRHHARAVCLDSVASNYDVMNDVMSGGLPPEPAEGLHADGGQPLGGDKALDIPQAAQEICPLAFPRRWAPAVRWHTDINKPKPCCAWGVTV